MYYIHPTRQCRQPFICDACTYRTRRLRRFSIVVVCVCVHNQVSLFIILVKLVEQQARGSCSLSLQCTMPNLCSVQRESSELLCVYVTKWWRMMRGQQTLCSYGRRQARRTGRTMYMHALPSTL